MTDGAPRPDDGVPSYQKRIALVVGIAAVVGIAVGWSRFVADFWPPDRSFVGPNLVASVVQWAIVLIVAALLWPPTRRRIHAFVDKKAAALHEAECKDREELHRKLDHLIAHTAPPLPPKESSGA